MNGTFNVSTLPSLPDNQYYIYVIQNSDGYIKIGKTSNPVQRFRSLSGSNGGGSKIIENRRYCSPATYLYTLETIFHDYYCKYRIDGTEWFDGLNYKKVIEHIDEVFSSHDYEICNQERQRYNERINK